MAQGKHVCKRINSDLVLYRGKEIEKRAHIPTGYSGRYEAMRRYYSTLRDAKQAIDNACLAKGINSFMTPEREKEYIALYKD